MNAVSWRRNGSAKRVGLKCAISYSAKQIAQFRLTHFAHDLSAIHRPFLA
jgi:hypothetical protein